MNTAVKLALHLALDLVVGEENQLVVKFESLLLWNAVDEVLHSENVAFLPDYVGDSSAECLTRLRGVLKGDGDAAIRKEDDVAQPTVLRKFVGESLSIHLVVLDVLTEPEEEAVPVIDLVLCFNVLNEFEKEVALALEYFFTNSFVLFRKG